MIRCKECGIKKKGKGIPKFIKMRVSRLTKYINEYHENDGLFIVSGYFCGKDCLAKHRAKKYEEYVRGVRAS